MRPSRFVPSLVLIALVVSLAACGGGGGDESADASGDGGGEALASLPAGCDNSEPLEVTFDGHPAVSGPLEVAGGVALPFAVLPGEASLVEMSDEELQAAVDGSDLRAYAIAVTDFPFGPDDAGSFYGLFSTPTAPESGGTSVIMTVLPTDGPLVDGSVVDAGAELGYADELQTTSVETQRISIRTARHLQRALQAKIVQVTRPRAMPLRARIPLQHRPRRPMGPLMPSEARTPLQTPLQRPSPNRQRTPLRVRTPLGTPTLNLQPMPLVGTTPSRSRPRLWRMGATTPLVAGIRSPMRQRPSRT